MNERRSSTITRSALVADLLVSLFPGVDELYGVANRYYAGCFADLAQAGATPNSAARKIVSVLEARNLIDSEFFARLREQRGRRADDIDRVEREWNERLPLRLATARRVTVRTHPRRPLLTVRVLGI